MNLAEQIIIDGLQGKETPGFARGKYIFVAELGDEYPLIGEGASPFEALMNGLEKGIELDGGTIDFSGDIEDPSVLKETEELPADIGKTNDARLIFFLLDMSNMFDFKTAADNFQKDPYFYDILRNFDDTKFVFGWSASPPRQEEAFAVLEVVESEATDE